MQPRLAGAATGLRVGVTLLAVAAAAFVGWRLWLSCTLAPWTRDARVMANVVEIAPDVSGLVGTVNVVDNQRVRRRDALFVIDQERFKVAVIDGVVEGLSRAIAYSGARSGPLAQVNPNFDWIRLAQRIAVRIGPGSSRPGRARRWNVGDRLGAPKDQLAVPAPAPSRRAHIPGPLHA